MNRSSCALLLCIGTMALIVVGTPFGGDHLVEARRAVGNDPEAGWRVLRDEGCLECHSLWGRGGVQALDLSRTGPTLTRRRLASALSQHVRFGTGPSPSARLSEAQVRDLASFLFFASAVAPVGDPEVGRAVLEERGCFSCHDRTRGESAATSGPRQWARASNPILWAQTMTQHPVIPVPNRALSEDDLEPVISYLQTLESDEARLNLEPGSPERGQRRIDGLRCRVCHGPGRTGADLEVIALPERAAVVAFRLGQHTAQIRLAAPGHNATLAPQAMADVVAALLQHRRTSTRTGAGEPRSVFEERGCAECHRDESTQAGDAPAPSRLMKFADPAALAAALWNHGVFLTLDERTSWAPIEPHEIGAIAQFLAPLHPSSEPGTLNSIEREWPPLFADRTSEGCLSASRHLAIASRGREHAPAGQGACAACHEVVDVDTHRFELSSNRAALCYACHPDPELSAAASETPLEVCTSCHDPHGDDSRTGVGEAEARGNASCFDAFLGGSSPRLEWVTRETAAEFSTSEAPVPPAPEDPGNAVAAESAADASGPSPHVKPTSIEGGCVSGGCHQSQEFGAYLHTANQQEQCRDCHRVVDAAEHAFALTADEPMLCVQCHEPIEHRIATSPGPCGVVELQCTQCHDPHRESREFQLKDDAGELCFGCHESLRDLAANSRSVHEPWVAGRRCANCHDPHRGDAARQSGASEPESCFTCHEALRDRVVNAAFPHAAVEVEKKCSNCHLPHASRLPSLLADGDAALCLGCHDRKMVTERGTLSDIKSLLEASPHHHRPIRDGGCSHCHDPHGSNYAWNLIAPYPETFYAPFSLDTYRLCFECHEESILLEPETDTLTAFRNGKQNLHHLHVNQDKGRTCRACHEVHASDHPKQMVSLVPFRTYLYRVNFELSEHGGRCDAGCHVARAYDRRQAVVQD